jgi:hypothetical protein
LLEQNDAPLVARVNRAAADWYEKKPGLDARAEELYHRLHLAEPSARLDQLWLPGVADRLRLDPEEVLPPASREWLALRPRDNETSSDAGQRIDFASIVRLAARNLELGDTHGSLKILEQLASKGKAAHGRKSLLGPLLNGSLLTAEALVRLGEFGRANRVATETRSNARAAGDVDATLRAALLTAWTARTQAAQDDEQRALDEAMNLRVVLGPPFDSALLARVCELGLPSDPKTRVALAALRDQAARLLSMGRNDALMRDRTLARYVLSVAGTEDSYLIAGALEIWGLEGVDLDRFEFPPETTHEEQRWLLELTAGMFGLSVSDGDGMEAAWKRVLVEAATREVGPRILADLCHKAPGFGHAMGNAWKAVGREVLYGQLLGRHQALVSERVSLLEPEIVDGVVEALEEFPQVELSESLRAHVGPGVQGQLPALPEQQLKADFRTLVHGSKNELVNWLSAAHQRVAASGSRPAAKVLDAALRTLGVADWER